MDAHLAAERPDFSDPRLQAAFEQCADSIDSFTDKLDALSNDIKSLEAYLAGSAVRIETQVEIPGSRQGNSFAFIAWEKGEPDRWRIIYGSRWDGGGDYPEGEKQILIEAPLEVRVKARRALPDLLRAVARAAELDDTATPGQSYDDFGPPPDDDDIPF